MRTATAAARGHAALILLLTAACSSEFPPTAPDAPTTPADLAKAAFQLTIDVPTGRVSVAFARQAATASSLTPGGPTFSLVGNDIVTLHATDCTFTAVPNNSKQKRCTLGLAIENRLKLVDLVTPTTFPRAPAGTDGLLVFPFTSAGLGVPGGGAAPTTAWDNGPTNFFNDFGGCSGGKTSDCYRWERFPSPLAAGATSASRPVGFDVDKAAQSVSVFIVVAADVRDAEPKRLTLGAEVTGCGSLRQFIGGQSASLGALHVFQPSGAISYGLCSFALPALLRDKNIVGATLTLSQVSMDQEFFDNGRTVEADWVTYDVPIALSGFFTIDFLKTSLATVTETLDAGPRTVDVLAAVLGDLAADRARTQFRLSPKGPLTTGLGEVVFDGTDGDNPPSLTILYRER
jgi:hypothetical protein